MSNPYSGYGEFGSAYRRRQAQKGGGLLGVVGKVGEWVDRNVVAPLTPQGPAPEGMPTSTPEGAGGENFDEWYRSAAMRYGLPPNPDQADYDYRRAFAAGVREPVNGAWPGQYKRNRFQ